MSTYVQPKRHQLRELPNHLTPRLGIHSLSNQRPIRQQRAVRSRVPRQPRTPYYSYRYPAPAPAAAPAPAPAFAMYGQPMQPVQQPFQYYPAAGYAPAGYAQPAYGYNFVHAQAPAAFQPVAIPSKPKPSYNYPRPQRKTPWKSSWKTSSWQSSQWKGKPRGGGGGGKEDYNQCWTFKNTGSCRYGNKCRWVHDARSAAAAAPTRAKSPAAGGVKAVVAAAAKKGGSAEPAEAVAANQLNICWEFNTARGCLKKKCRWLHEAVAQPMAHPYTKEEMSGTYAADDDDSKQESNHFQLVEKSKLQKKGSQSPKDDETVDID